MLTQEDLSPEEQALYEVFTPLVREYRVTDQHFIMKTWLRTFQHERYDSGKQRFYDKQQELIRRLCTQDNARVAIVCDAANQDYIVGFAVSEEIPEQARKPMVLHFAYTRQSYRKNGLFKKMLTALGWYDGRTILCTHWTRVLYALKTHFKIERDEWLLMGIVKPEEV